MDYRELSFAARLLNPMSDQPPVLVRRNSLAGIPGNNTDILLNAFFGTEERRWLSRTNVMNLSRKNIVSFSLSVLFWGFPTKYHGICGRAFQNWDALLTWIRSLRRNRSMTHQQFEEMIPVMHNALHGLGISTLSKYLYFTGCSIDGHRCLILDNQVAKGINRLTGNEFVSLKDAVQNNRHRHYIYYSLYLEAMNNLSTNIGVPAQNLEYVLWLAGKKNL